MSNLTINSPTNLTQKPERTAYIYKATNLLDGMSYVGQSVEPFTRISNHFRGYDNDYFHNALKLYGKENFEWQIIMSGPESSISDVEIGCIVLEGTKSPLGYNLTDGGEGTHGRICSEETRQKISISNLGKKMSEEFKNQKRDYMLAFNHMSGGTHTEGIKQILSQKSKAYFETHDSYWKDKNLSEEHRCKISATRIKIGIPAWNKGIPRTEVERAKMKVGQFISNKNRRRNFEFIEKISKIQSNGRKVFFCVCKCEQCGKVKHIRSDRYNTPYSQVCGC
jgi:hypothetical protein